LKIYLLDRKQSQVDFWELYFSDIKNVECVCDDFAHFMDTHDVECVVSPANSYGLMDGGYDAAITAYFGDALIPHVQEYIRTHFFCEQPVGTSFLIDIPGSAKKLIHTPTMRVPSVIREPLVVYQCTRTTLISAMQNDIKSLVIPAFGGSCGNVPPQKIALLMRGAFDQLWTMPSSMDWNYANRGLERI